MSGSETPAPSGVVVERAVVEDWRTVKAVRLAALADAPDAFSTTLLWARSFSDNIWQWRLQGAFTTLLARLEGQAVGMCVIGPQREQPAIGGLYAMWVAPDARGKGVGDALIRGGLDLARERGFSRVLLDVGDDNAPAIALYRRHGFLPTGRRATLPEPREHITEHELGLTLG